MLKHLNETKIKPTRVVVLGSQGFVGRYALRQLKSEGIETVGISKNEVNLLYVDAEKMLLEKLNLQDTLVVVSALAPCKNTAMLIDNLRMMQIVGNVIEKISLSHVVYISSDAAYADDVTLATEDSSTAPTSFHGMMHSCRELILKQAAKKTPLAILRPSLLYGRGDPHHGYGPNRFIRLAEKNEPIVLFGNGEEKRDHVFICDVAHIIALVVQHRSEGILNLASGHAYSFREIAEIVLSEIECVSEIQATPRNNPIMHRHFNIAALYKAFPAFQPTQFKMGLKQVLQQSTLSMETT